MIRTTRALFKLSSSAAICLFAAAAAQASVTYNYTGLDFTNFGGVYNSSTQVNITASITVDAALPDDFSGAITPDSWEISDYSLTLTKASPNIAQTVFDFTTNGSGQITDWAMRAAQTNGAAGYSELTTEYGSDEADSCGGSKTSECSPLYGDAYVAYPDNAPNTVTTDEAQPSWVVEQPASPAPEPGTPAMMAGGLVMIALGWKRRLRMRPRARLDREDGASARILTR